LAGQAVGTLEVGASVVEYDGFLVSGAAVLSPAINFRAPNLSLGAQGTWVIFESGNEILQATAAAAWLKPLHTKWQLEFSGSLGAANYAGREGYGHVLGRTRLHFQERHTGAWLGGGTGQSFGEFNGTPFELAAGAWVVREGVSLSGSITANSLAGDGYVDVVGVIGWSGARARVDAQLGVRPWAEGAGGAGVAERGAFAEVTTILAVHDRVTLVLNAGRGLSDPVRGILGAKYADVGVRLNLGRRRSSAPIITDAFVRAERELVASEHASRAQLEILTSGEATTLRVYLGGSESVELIGDFTDWQPVALTPAGDGSWEIRLPIASGVHRLNIRSDGGPWRVPLGTRLEQSEFGGAVGVVVVP
jgi:hypothetical protein